MAKIGRNEPCPCGSGKKFKKCCIDTPIMTPFETVRDFHWSTVEVETVATEEIILKLRGFGVDFNEKQFQKEVRKFYSACDLAQYWKKKFPVTAISFDLDFIWMACVVLWKRLAPDVINSEQIDDLMQEGYDLVLSEEKHSKAEGCNLWLRVWDELKPRFSSDMKSIEDTGKVFSGMQSLFNWCQDLEMELHNCGIHDRSFFKKRIKFCKEFCSFFPNSDASLVVNMRRSEAESYFELGEFKEGEQAFKALIEDYPKCAWGYIGWGDVYWLFKPDGTDKNLTKAREIYQMALKAETDEKKHVIERLQALKEEHNKHSV